MLSLGGARSKKHVLRSTASGREGLQMIEQNLGEAVRRLRERQNMSLRTLAERANFSPSFLCQVENGQASPSIASTERIALALGVTLGQFFQVAEKDLPLIVTAEKRPIIRTAWSKARIEALGPTNPLSTLEPVMISIAPGGTSGKHAYASPRDEFAIVFKGIVSLTLQREVESVVERLHEGDAATIRAGLPRRWENEGSDLAQIVVVSARL